MMYKTRSFITLMALLCFSGYASSGTNLNKLRSCKNGHIAFSDTWIFCPVCGVNFPSPPTLKSSDVFREETIIGNKYINTKYSFSIERPSEEWEIHKTKQAKVLVHNPAVSVAFDFEQKFWVMVIAENTSYMTLNELMDFQSNFQEETAPKSITISERSCIIAGLPAFELYKKLKMEEISSPFFMYSSGIISKKHDKSFQIFIWGSFEAYTKGIAEKIVSNIVSTFKILEE